MKYTKKDIHKGMKLKCIRKTSTSRWSIGSIYTTTKDKFGKIVLIDDWGTEWHANLIKDFLNDFGHVYFKEENSMQEFKVGDLVEVLKNNSHAYKNKSDFFQVGDTAVVTEVMSFDVRICEKESGNKCFGNVISKHEIKKVEPELTEYEEELVLRLAKSIELKDNYVKELEDLRYKTLQLEEYHEKVSKEIEETLKKLLTK